MKIKLLFSAVSLCAVLLLVFWQRETRPSPGPLSAVHERDARIEEQDCKICHEGVSKGFAPCAKCHKEVQERVEKKIGLHGRLQDPGDCGLCHAEHRGSGGSLVTEAAFRRAGFEGRDSYKHEGIRFGLRGAHQKLTCVKCHKMSKLPLLPEGKKRFLGLVQDCASCHEDPHKGKQGKDCASCHGQEKPFDQVATFAHSEKFPLEGGHAGLACAKCHSNLRDRSNEEIRQETGKRCIDCHKDPHREGGESLHFATKGQCETCHDTESFQKPLLGTKDHARFGPALVGVHKEEDCVSCHSGGKERSLPQRMRILAEELRPEIVPENWVPKDPKDCVVCHLSPHRQSFLEGQGLGDSRVSCSKCHQAEARHFALPEARMDREIHAKGGVPLRGAHESLHCDDCHKSADLKAEEGGDLRAVFAGFRRRFPGRDMAACRTCHEDIHQGDFIKGPFAKAECSSCHTERHFSPSLFDPEEHAKTGFALTGAHGALACMACHKEKKRLGERVVHRFSGLESNCASCHANPHGDRLLGGSLPRGSAHGDKKQWDCASCHGTSDFHHLKKGAFDHNRDTHFPLVGAHKEAACARCHAKATKGTDGRLHRESPPKTCEVCHDDPHLGQFRRMGSNDCLACHDQQRFKPVHFDHEKSSRFALGKNHARVACAACHKPVRLKTGEDVILYKPLPRTCKGCHGLPGKVGK